jgi:hypothetical protein
MFSDFIHCDVPAQITSLEEARKVMRMRARTLEDCHHDCGVTDCLVVVAVLAVLVRTHPASDCKSDGHCD